MRIGGGPPTSLTWASTSSAMVRTWRRLCPLVMTKASVIDSTPPTSRTTVFSAFLAEAARAAVVTQCRMASSVTPLSIEVLADHHRDVDHVERLATQDEPAGPQGLADTLRRLLSGPVVEHDLRLSVGEAVGIAAQDDAATGGHETPGDARRRPDGAGAVEDLHAYAVGRDARQQLAHELIEVALPHPVDLVDARPGLDRLHRQGLVGHAARGQLAHDAGQVGRQAGRN